MEGREGSGVRAFGSLAEFSPVRRNDFKGVATQGMSFNLFGGSHNVLHWILEKIGS